MTDDWQKRADAARARLSRKVLVPEWTLAPSLLSTLATNIIPIIRESGILTPTELEITEAPDACEVLAKIKSKQWSAKEVTIAFCKRAAIAHQLVNCLMDANFEDAVKRAIELDEHLAKTGETVGPLHGLPISIKDLTSVKGMHYSIGFASWSEKVSTHDAVVVQILKKAGAVIYVKTTMPQTGMASETTSNLWGRTLNPYNTRLTPGGSSGGEGALNACRGAPLGIGTDVGGSIRGPAAFSGLYGLKPTSRRCSYYGNVIPVPGQIAIPSAIGPIGRSLRDLELICQVWAQDEPWRRDPTVVPLPWKSQAVPKKAVIGVMWWDEVVMPHPPIQRALKAAVGKLRAAGHEGKCYRRYIKDHADFITVVDFKPYKHGYSWEITRPLFFPTAAKQHKDILAESGEAMIPAAAELIADLKDMSATELMAYQAKQSTFQAEYLKHWEDSASLTTTRRPVDAILCPSFGSASHPHDTYCWWGYFSVWNLLNYPAIVLPVGHVDAQVDAIDRSYVPGNPTDKANHDLYNPELFHNAPISLQLVGRYMEEEKLMAVANAFDQAVIRS